MGESIINLKNNETAVVGYGSLLSISSIGRTLKREYNGPFVICHLEGWRRSWDVSMPNSAYYYVDKGYRIYPEKILYLNVRPAPGELLNCVVFVVNSDELESMNSREWIYSPISVNSILQGVQIKGGNAILYVGSEGHILHDVKSPKEAAIRGSYLLAVEMALQKMTPSFREEYSRTTDIPPASLIIEDFLDSERPNPWAVAGKDYRPD